MFIRSLWGCNVGWVYLKPKERWPGSSEIRWKYVQVEHIYYTCCVHTWLSEHWMVGCGLGSGCAWDCHSKTVTNVSFATHHGILLIIAIGPEDRTDEIAAWRRDEVSV